MSGKEVHKCHGKYKRVADLIRNSLQEAPANNSLAKPLKKRHRQEIPSSPPMQFPRGSQPTSSEGVSQDEMGVSQDEMWTSFFIEFNGSGDDDDTLTWDVGFPLGDLIYKYFGKEKFHEKVKELGLEKELQSSMADADCNRMIFLLRVIGGMFGDIEKENKAFIEEITEMKILMTSLKDERDKLKRTLEESSLEKSQLIAKLKTLMEEFSKSNAKLLVKEDARIITIDKLKTEIEELKGEILSQYKVGFENAINQVLSFAARLEP